MDTAELKRTWGLAESLGEDVPLFFYSHLFLAHPEVRPMFPVSMSAQRDRFVAALGRIVSNVDDLDETIGYLQQLGRDHRRFDVVAAQYSVVGASLLATLQNFLGEQWTPELAADWAEAYGIVATVMVQAAEESEESSPASWVATVTSVDRRTIDVAVLQVVPEQQYDFAPGQSFAAEVESRPRVWRYFSPASAPRADGSIKLHVQLVAGGQVSPAMVKRLKPGDSIRMGAPVGIALTLTDEDRERPLLMVAGGTGLSPLRAHLEYIDRESKDTARTSTVHLLHGSRYPWNFYDHRVLSELSSRPWFDYTPVVSDDHTYPGQQGNVGDVAAAADLVALSPIALVCGSGAMVAHTVAALRSAGIPEADIRYEAFASPDGNSDLNTTTPDPEGSP